MSTQIKPFSDVKDQLPADSSQKKHRGWYADSGKDLAFYNQDKRIMLIHAAVCDGDNALYDQFIVFEEQGAITAVRNSKGEYGFVKVFRVVAKDLAEFDAKSFYDRWMSGDKTVIDQLGTYSWECPRGMPHRNVDGPRGTAEGEAAEELGSPVLWARQIGSTVWNTTFSTTPQPIFLAQIDEEFSGTIPPDVNERILKVQWFAPEAIDRMILSGEIFCGVSMAAVRTAEAYLRQNNNRSSEVLSTA